MGWDAADAVLKAAIASYIVEAAAEMRNATRSIVADCRLTGHSGRCGRCLERRTAVGQRGHQQRTRGSWTCWASPRVVFGRSLNELSQRASPRWIRWITSCVRSVEHPQCRFMASRRLRGSSVIELGFAAGPPRRVFGVAHGVESVGDRKSG